MAKGKGKPSTPAVSRLRKMHGPKRHFFRDLKPMVHQYGALGVLSKYYAFESWSLACQARGIKNPTRTEFAKFVILPTIKAKDEYFSNIKK